MLHRRNPSLNAQLLSIAAGWLCIHGNKNAEISFMHKNQSLYLTQGQRIICICRIAALNVRGIVQTQHRDMFVPMKRWCSHGNSRKA